MVRLTLAATSLGSSGSSSKPDLKGDSKLAAGFMNSARSIIGSPGAGCVVRAESMAIMVY